MRRAVLVPVIGLQAWVAATTAYLLGLLGIAAVKGAPPREPAPSGEPLRTVVIVPAHDEESGLGRTLGYLEQQDFPADRLEVVVIADNCSDGTADVARRRG